MIMQMFAVYDAVAKAFATPFFMRSEAEALRAFASEVNNPQSQLHASHADYSLHLIGEFDDAGGVVVSNGKQLAKASAVLRPVSQEEV